MIFMDIISFYTHYFIIFFLLIILSPLIIYNFIFYCIITDGVNLRSYKLNMFKKSIEISEIKEVHNLLYLPTSAIIIIVDNNGQHIYIHRDMLNVKYLINKLILINPYIKLKLRSLS